LERIWAQWDISWDSAGNALVGTLVTNMQILNFERFALK